MNKKYLSGALVAALVVPQLAVTLPADAATHAKKKNNVKVVTRTITKTVYRTIEKPVVITREIEKPVVVTETVSQPILVEQDPMIYTTPISTYSAVVPTYPTTVAYPSTVVNPYYNEFAPAPRPFLNRAIGGAAMGAALGAGTGALIGGLSRHHHAGRGALTGLGIGAAAGALLGGLGGRGFF